MRTQLETRMQVVYTLDAMLENAPYRGVRVARLCEEMGISRTAFYRYFPTLGDVPNWLWGHILSESLERIGPDCTFFEGHVRCFERLLGWRDFFAKVFRDEEADSPVKLGSRSVLDLYLRKARENGLGEIPPARLLEVRFYNDGASAMTRAWAIGGMREPPRAMAVCFDAMAPEHLKAVLQTG